MQKRAAKFFALFLSALSSATTAHAEEEQAQQVQAYPSYSVATDEIVSDVPFAQLYLDNVFGGVSGGGDNSSIFWTPILGTNIRVLPQLVLGAKIPFAMGAYSGPEYDETRFYFGNPYLEGLYVYAVDTIDFRAGAGLAMPGAWIPDDDLGDAIYSALTYYGAGLSRGLLDYWLYRPETLSLIAPAHLIFRPTGGFVLRGDVAVGVGIGVGDQDTAGYFQFEAAAGYDFGGVEAGLRFAGALVIYKDDVFQSSLSPYVRANFGGFYGQAMLILNLDNPGGFSFDDGRITGGQLLIGTNIN